MTKIITRCVSIVLTILCAVILIFTITMKKGDDKGILGLHPMIVLTGSMSPTFNAGSFILSETIDPNKIKVGDILTYRVIDVPDKTFLTHRVVKVDNSNNGPVFTTRGDANNTDDPKIVKKEQVLGKTVFWINGLGRFLVWVRTPLRLTIFVGLAILLAFFGDIVNFFKALKKEEDEKKAELK